MSKRSKRKQEELDRFINEDVASMKAFLTSGNIVAKKICTQCHEGLIEPTSEKTIYVCSSCGFSFKSNGNEFDAVPVVFDVKIMN